MAGEMTLETYLGPELSADPSWKKFLQNLQISYQRKFQSIFHQDGWKRMNDSDAISGAIEIILWTNKKVEQFISTHTGIFRTEFAPSELIHSYLNQGVEPEDVFDQMGVTARRTCAGLTSVLVEYLGEKIN